LTGANADAELNLDYLKLWAVLKGVELRPQYKRKSATAARGKARKKKMP
jgi:hypothetical protein